MKSDEENKIKEWHDKYDVKIDALIQLTNQMMKTKNQDKLLYLCLLVQKEIEQHQEMFTESERLLWLYQATLIFMEECQNHISPTIFHVCHNYEDLIYTFRKIKFGFWRILFLQEPADELMDFIENRKISICTLYYYMACSFENKREGIKILMELSKEKKEWQEYIKARGDGL